MLSKPTVRLLATLFSVVSVLAASAAIAPAMAGAAQRIDMKVLVLGTSSTEPDLMAWQAALQREGVPYETIITAGTHTPITAATLSDTLANGTQEAKYQAVIVTVGQLPECTSSGCVSTLSQTEWTALEEYEQTFNIRQVTGDIFPGAGYGLNSPTVAGELGAGATEAKVQGTLTTEGKAIFPYLQGQVAMDVGTYGYEATPLESQAAGASFTPLLSGPNSSALVGIYTHPNGVQEMVETFNENASQLQAELLRHGALNWVTRGVYFGSQRNYYEADIDDNFLFDDSWDTATHTTDYNPEDAIRENPVDVEYAAKWSQEHNFRIDMLFNGGGSVSFAEGNTSTLGGNGGSTGGTTKGGGSTEGTDPLLTAFKQYKGSFGWISHTWDHPNIDIRCATQNYIEAEFNENNSWAASALGLTESTEPTAALGNDNPSVIITGEHSGLANLLPGNPGVVDPPDLDTAEGSTSGGTLPAGSYIYAVTDDFTPGAGQSSATESAPVAVTGSTSSVTLTWAAVCHAAEFKIYRELAGSNEWKLIATDPAPTEAPPNSWFGNPTNSSKEIIKTEVTNGGALEQTFTDTGSAGETSAGPPAANEAVESPYPQNPNLIPAFEGVGIRYFGSDASKPYPNSTIPGSTEAAYPDGSTFTDGPALAIPRYPTNIYYNVSTEAEEVDEYNTLYTPPPAGKCIASPTNTCETKPANFAEIVASIDTNMFQHVMGNDPRPHYFHQPNMMGVAPAEPPTGTPPATSRNVGDGLFYSVLNPLLEAYSHDFNVPLEQLTMAQIGELLAEQQAWSKANSGQVNGYIEGNKVTIQNSGSEVSMPLSGVTGVGSTYGGTQSGWTKAPAATSTYTALTSWPTASEPVQQEPQGSWVGKVGSRGYLLANWDGVQDLSNMPGVTASLVQGSRYQWVANTSDVRALQGPEGSPRSADAYYGTSQVKLQLNFSSAYSGNLSLYAVDWDKQGRRESIIVNDGTGPREVVLGADFSAGAWVSIPINVSSSGTVTITVSRLAGSNAVLSGVFLGTAGAPPATNGLELSKGGWVGSVGAAGYDLAGWYGTNGDYASTPGVSVNVVRGSRYRWAANTTDGRALSEAQQLTRTAGAYYDPNQVQVKLTFSAAYSGNLRLYSVDWDSTARREMITVNGQTAILSSSFHEGAWLTFPVSVAAGGTVTITVDRLAGSNAVISGIFIGDAGTPPYPSAPQGNWVGTFGSAGYVLSGWNGTSDLASLPTASLTLEKGNRYQWASTTTDVRALQNSEKTTRVAAAYYSTVQIQAKLTFTAAYSGNLELYAVDWDKGARRETITVNGQTATLASDFSQGAWVTFPINIASGGTVTITVNRTAGPNAVLSGIFLN